MIIYIFIYPGLPITFLLGFYVYLVVKRWWEQYCKLPWPDTMAFFLRGLVVEGDEEVRRLVRRTVIRYCLLAYILCIRKFSDRLRRRFPGIQNKSVVTLEPVSQNINLISSLPRRPSDTTPHRPWTTLATGTRWTWPGPELFWPGVVWCGRRTPIHWGGPELARNVLLRGTEGAKFHESSFCFIFLSGAKEAFNFTKIFFLFSDHFYSLWIILN